MTALLFLSALVPTVNRVGKCNRLTSIGSKSLLLLLLVAGRFGPRVDLTLFSVPRAQNFRWAPSAVGHTTGRRAGRLANAKITQWHDNAPRLVLMCRCQQARLRRRGLPDVNLSLRSIPYGDDECYLLLCRSTRK